MATPPPSAPLFSRGSWPEVSRIGEILRAETVGGALLVVGAVLALVWANSPWRAAYTALSELRVGPAALHLDLTLTQWAADGLLAVFFFVAGLELKREFIAGDLRSPRRAVLPVAAAVGGMAAPALVFVAVNVRAAPGVLAGWAIPTATDIAFALAVLAVVGAALPTALRTFLLTLAVVDDLLAIAIIAVFYTAELDVLPLALAVVPLGLFAVLVQRRVRSWWLLLPIAVVTWALVHASGVHATVAGVLLGLTVPVVRRAAGQGPGLAEHFEHRFRPISTGVAVPVFAFFAAGVSVVDAAGRGLADPIVLGIVLALVVGKTVGVLGATWLVQRFTRAQLAPELSWWDVLGLALLSGIGFTVSLLIGELAYGANSDRDDLVKIGVLVGSGTAALLASVVLRIRHRHYRALQDAETIDTDHDGVPDAYQDDASGRRRAAPVDGAGTRRNDEEARDPQPRPEPRDRPAGAQGPGGRGRLRAADPP